MSNKWARQTGNGAPDDGKAAETPEDSLDAARDDASLEAAAGAEAIDLGIGGDADTIAALEAEKADLKDQLLRALAEVENVRRRSQKEKEDIGRFAASNLARDMLSVADNLSRTLEAIPSDALADDHELNGLYRGIELVERDLQQAFERHGITKIVPLGEKFDHNLHQAMFEIEDPDVEPGIVVQLMAPGYVINGRLLRPAMVGVAKGGQKKPPVETAANGDDGDAETAEPSAGTTPADDAMPPRQ